MVVPLKADFMDGTSKLLNTNALIYERTKNKFAQQIHK